MYSFGLGVAVATNRNAALPSYRRISSRNVLVPPNPRSTAASSSETTSKLRGSSFPSRTDS